MSVLDRAARVAYTFLVMNYSAVAGLFVLGRGRDVWRPTSVGSPIDQEIRATDE